MINKLKKLYANPDDVKQKLVASAYYQELHTNLKKLVGQELTIELEAFYLPEFAFKSQDSDEDDVQPLIWVGNIPTVWQKQLKDRNKYALGMLKTDVKNNKLVFELQEGSGAKEIIMKKVARFVKKTKMKGYLQLQLASGQAVSVTKGIIEDAKKVGSAMTSPYSRIVKMFTQYKSAPVVKRISVLANLNTLLYEWKHYDSALKASEQIEQIKVVKEYLDGNIKALIMEVDNYVGGLRERFLRGANKALVLFKEAPNDEEKQDALISLLVKSKRLRSQLHNIEQIIKDTHGVKNWFSKTIGTLSRLSTILRRHDIRIENKVKEIEHQLKLKGVTYDINPIDEAVLELTVPDDAPRGVRQILKSYNEVLNNGENMGARAPDLQTQFMFLLEELADLSEDEYPWTKELKTQIREAKDSLGEYLYERDNYQKIQKLYNEFLDKRDDFDDLDKTEDPQKTEKIVQRLIVLIEDLGIEIGEWEDKHLQYSTFEVKERSKRIESIRRVLTQFLAGELLDVATDAEEVEDLLDSSVFMIFTNTKNYADATELRKVVKRIKLTTEEATKKYAKHVENRVFVDKKKFDKAKIQKIIELCNQVDEDLKLWTIQAQRCDLGNSPEKEQAELNRVAYEEDDSIVELSIEWIREYGTNARDILNLVLTFDANKDVIQTLNDEITALKKSINSAKSAIHSEDDLDKKSIGMMRSDLLQKEEQLQVIFNMLKKPYKRLLGDDGSRKVLSVENGFSTAFIKQIDEVESREIDNEIE